MRSKYNSRWFLTATEIILAMVVLVVIITYVNNWSQKMASHSLWTDEIYTVSHFSSRGPLTALTDYHAPNNHIFFNFSQLTIP